MLLCMQGYIFCKILWCGREGDGCRGENENDGRKKEKGNDLNAHYIPLLICTVYPRSFHYFLDIQYVRMIPNSRLKVIRRNTRGSV